MFILQSICCECSMRFLLQCHGRGNGAIIPILQTKKLLLMKVAALIKVIQKLKDKVRMKILFY